jgi:uncharacterized membrane protein YhhN
MSYTFLVVPLLIGLGEWIAVAKGWRRAEYVLKPATLIALFVWMALNGGLSGQMLWFSLGVLFSLAGDLLLMLPEKMFIGGLIAFLLAHISYTIGFNTLGPPYYLASLIPAAMIILTTTQFYRHVAAGMRASGQANLVLPGLVYAVAIGLMVYSASLTLVKPDWPAWPALLASAGALLFYISDMTLSWNKCVRPLSHCSVITMVTYHLGQILIVLGAAIYYSPIS